MKAGSIRKLGGYRILTAKDKFLRSHKNLLGHKKKGSIYYEKQLQKLRKQQQQHQCNHQQQAQPEERNLRYAFRIWEVLYRRPVCCRRRYGNPGCCQGKQRAASQVRRVMLPACIKKWALFGGFIFLILVLIIYYIFEVI